MMSKPGKRYSKKHSVLPLNTLADCVLFFQATRAFINSYLCGQVSSTGQRKRNLENKDENCLEGGEEQGFFSSLEIQTISDYVVCCFFFLRFPAPECVVKCFHLQLVRARDLLNSHWSCQTASYRQFEFSAVLHRHEQNLCYLAPNSPFL